MQSNLEKILSKPTRMMSAEEAVNVSELPRDIYELKNIKEWCENLQLLCQAKDEVIWRLV